MFEIIEPGVHHGVERSGSARSVRHLTVVEATENYPLWYDLTGDIAELETLSLCVNE